MLEADAEEYILSGGQPCDQRLGGEIRLRQGIDGSSAHNVYEAVAGRDLDQHARGPIRARPDHAGIDRHVARLDAVRDERAVSRPAEIGVWEVTRGSERRSRRPP